MKPEHSIQNPGQIKGLFEKAKQGDREAFSAIYTMYYSPIYRFLYYRLKDAEKTLDLTQDVFHKAYRSIENFSHKDVSPLAYFYTIARNTLIDTFRKERPTSSIDDEDFYDNFADESQDPQADAIREESARIVRKALFQLPPLLREIMIMRYVDDLSNKEIAQVTGKKEDAIRQVQSRGLKALREILKKYE